MFAGMGVSLYFSYHIFYGARSFSNLSRLDSVVVSKENALETVRGEREVLESRVQKMRPGSLSLDMLEEQVRLVLAYKKPDEVFIVGN